MESFMSELAMPVSLPDGGRILAVSKPARRLRVGTGAVYAGSTGGGVSSFTPPKRRKSVS